MPQSDPCSSISEENNDASEEELKVTFNPPLYQQRRMWILDFMRSENSTNILDIGCGEGALLEALTNAAPWLKPPPKNILPPSDYPNEDNITNLHPTAIAGLDISVLDLQFAIQGTAPPPNLNSSPGASVQRYGSIPKRWEEMEAKIWKGGLQTLNPEFVGVECIVSSEVIEHLPPDIFPYFAPVLLGVYHPKILLITTPSYTFNSRFTAPNAPKSARKGFPDPTGRTDRVFRHDDHKFEWTVDEFNTWCHQVALEWGYKVLTSDLGKAMEKDPWNRDEALGGASLVASFRRNDDEQAQGVVNRERRAREVVQALDKDSEKLQHELVAHHHHPAHPKSTQPVSLGDIGEAVKAKMSGYGEISLRVGELWYEDDIPVLCGGWLEFLLRAVEEHENLDLRREGRFGRDSWTIELAGGIQRELWPKTADSSTFYLPVEEEYAGSSTEGEFSEDADADISWNESEEDEEMEARPAPKNLEWTDWNKTTTREPVPAPPPLSSSSSISGWEGDDDNDGDSTS
ncbi:hypothetical protein C8J56DRAFT_929997 [Mycena floridula]|nr:hypothetical protein C8J56DRAFT_929997 [Mycena floridula]